MRNVAPGRYLRVSRILRNMLKGHNLVGEAYGCVVVIYKYIYRDVNIRFIIVKYSLNIH